MSDISSPFQSFRFQLIQGCTSRTSFDFITQHLIDKSKVNSWGKCVERLKNIFHLRSSAFLFQSVPFHSVSSDFLSSDILIFFSCPISHLPPSFPSFFIWSVFPCSFLKFKMVRELKPLFKGLGVWGLLAVVLQWEQILPCHVPGATFTISLFGASAPLYFSKEIGLHWLIDLTVRQNRQQHHVQSFSFSFLGVPDWGLELWYSGLKCAKI